MLNIMSCLSCNPAGVVVGVDLYGLALKTLRFRYQSVATNTKNDRN